MKNTSVKDWYMKEYPDDDLGKEINPDLQFIHLLHVYFNDFYSYSCFYSEKLKVQDSIIRDRVAYQVGVMRECLK